MGLPQSEIYTKILSNRIIKNLTKLKNWSKQWNLAKIRVTSLQVVSLSQNHDFHLSTKIQINQRYVTEPKS